MALIYRIAGDGRPVPFTVTPTASAAPTAALYDDAALTIPHVGDAAPVVTGAVPGSSFAYTLPTTLDPGTFYVDLDAVTAGGPVTATDTVIVLAAAIVSGGTQVWAPSVGDVGTIISQRTVAADGLTITGTFTSTTRPSDTQVQLLIDQVVAHVAARVGEVPEELELAARGAAALGAAARVELSFFSTDDRYDDLNALYQQALDALVEAAEDIATSGEVQPDTGAGGSVLLAAPAYSFPEAAAAGSNVAPRTTWLERW